MKKTFLCLLALVMSSQVIVAQKSIVILYENDVHCGIDGYTKMAGLRDAIESQDTAYVGAVCCGDFLGSCSNKLMPPLSVPISLRQVSSLPSIPPTSSISMATRRWPLSAPAPLRR